MIDDKLKKFIENIPKAELHIHTDSVPPSVLLGCAKRNDIKLPFSTIQEAHEWIEHGSVVSPLNYFPSWWGRGQQHVSIFRSSQ